MGRGREDFSTSYDEREKWERWGRVASTEKETNENKCVMTTTRTRWRTKR